MRLSLGQDLRLVQKQVLAKLGEVTCGGNALK